MRAPHVQVTKFLRRLQKALRNGDVLVSGKAFEQATHELGLGIVQIFEVLEELAPVDFDARVPSSNVPGDGVWIFCPQFDDLLLWIRLVERRGIIVVSFHEA